MAMDYGPCYSDMGQAAVDAANATRNQLSANGLSAGVGITPMIGVNDITCENFTTSDANVARELRPGEQLHQPARVLGAGRGSGQRSYINIFKTFH